MKSPREPLPEPLIAGMAAGRRLPYVVELWDMARNAPEMVIGRAASLTVARTIFKASAAEHPGRRIVLRKGSRLIQATE